MPDKLVINYMLELIYKSNAILDLINPTDSLKLMEMSINKNDIMRKSNYQCFTFIIVDKSKLVIIKLDKMYLVIPMTITKVETKLRNVLINEKPKMEGLARFLNFYLNTFVSPVQSSATTTTIKEKKQVVPSDAKKV